ncbi:N-methyl-L-tryptophan oxidase [Parafrigoribacterium mesophilum]|uniref:FAD-dependent oxidoreductase n=1 Tax=Parafrigoribacterium mesophilum TaxID=433646 RepID=UPI0031FE1D18
MERVDTVIVGGGAMGLSAAWHLARRSRQVLLLERETIGHLGGASHGSTRNFNQAYSDRRYVAMLVESRRLWRELERESGTTLLDIVGIVNHGRNQAFDDVHAALSAAGIPAEFLPAAEARDRWPGIRFDSRVLYTPQSGRLRADAALAALQHGAIALGADIRQGTQVTKLAVQGDGQVRITTDDAQFDARRVIVTAGAWTEKLIGNVVPLPRLVVTQEQPAHFAAHDAAGPWPGFNHYPTPGDRSYEYWPSQIYGMQTPGEGIKVGWHGVGPVTDPDARTFTAEPVQLAALRRYVHEWLPGADPDTATELSCTYTTTPDTNFVLKRFGPITVGAGFSGHGFKFTPAVGRILADLSDRDL